MNLHEECLLKYLINPSGLSQSTELLILNNIRISRGKSGNEIIAKTSKINYTANRI